MGERSSTIAMILSFLFTGIGIVYLGNITKGLMLFAIGLICSFMGRHVLGLFNYIAFFIWIISLYLTYKELKFYKQKRHEMNNNTTRNRQLQPRTLNRRQPADNQYRSRTSHSHDSFNRRQLQSENRYFDRYDQRRNSYIERPHEDDYSRRHSLERQQTMERRPYNEKQHHIEKESFYESEYYNKR